MMLAYFAFILTAIGFVVSWLRNRYLLGNAVMAIGLAVYAIVGALQGRWTVFWFEVGCIGLLAIAALLYKRHPER